MKVCIDIQAAVAQRAGVGRYTKSLVEHLGACRGNNELELFYFDFKRRGTPFPAPGTAFKRVGWCPGRLIQQAWKNLSFPPFEFFAGLADVYHFPNFIIPPLRHGRAVVTIHDVSFLRHPETTEERNLAYLQSKIAQTVERADAIITDSAFSAREIEELLHVSSGKLHPIHLGLSAQLKRPAEMEIQNKLVQLGIQDPYILFVGTLEPRKNIPFLIEIFEHMAPEELNLVIAGMRGWKYEPILERIQSSSRSRRIAYLEYVGDASLPALYAGARAFVFPSLYEGFGFTPLEAMTCGTPVISSPAGSLEEVLGDAAHLVPGYEVDEWVQAVSDVVADEGLAETLRNRGYDHVKQFSWEKTAQATWDVYRRVQP